ncbi:outer membrane protein [Legionella sp. 31fI33]|uniref:outer membrane protein n=1 Tax=Legionella sp. 31fI33 TaxID=2886376 RepID=UPI001E487FA9|nr:outer membrane beta-barrel protein [Legionella sp. 31fI33]MCC5015597.1 outer membrane beta-barrel protein [Legionella sp. 31fI33]
MKQLRHIGFAGLLLASCSVFSAVPAEGWYAGATGILSYAPTINATHSHPSSPTVLAGTELAYSIGGGGTGQVGYRICYFRVEGELFFDYNPVTRLTVDGVSFKRHFIPFPFITPPFTPVGPGTPGVKIKGNTSFGGAMINGYYDIYDEDDDPSFVPYIGLGVGYAHIASEINFYGIAQPVTAGTSSEFFITGGKTSSNTPVGQIILGLSYFYNDETSFGLDYRYMTTRTISAFDTRFQVHTLNLFFNYTFSEA